MNLVIDIGNTFTKVEFFNENTSLAAFKWRTGKTEALIHKLNNTTQSAHTKAVIICSVATETTKLMAHFHQMGIFAITLTHDTPVPISNRYKTPETLGKDRLAAAIGAAHMYPQKEVLCIDMGTCIKYDFVNSRNEYLGGAISPGIQMRFKALNTFTEKLPLIQLRKTRKLTGANTDESILSGVYFGVNAEINGIIMNYKKLYPKLMLILSGGDMKNFENNLNFSIFAVQNIVNFGLNIILEYNKQKQN